VSFGQFSTERTKSVPSRLSSVEFSGTRNNRKFVQSAGNPCIGRTSPWTMFAHIREVAGPSYQMPSLCIDDATPAKEVALPRRRRHRLLGATVNFTPIRSTTLLRGARKSNSMPRPRQDNSSGKSPKTRPAFSQKIFRLTRRANQRYHLPVSPDKRGGSRSSRTCGEMRWTLTCF
jgi:hypothetical protein